MLRRYIGDKAFYRRVLGVALPIIIQNGITNFVSLLDNIMVGQVGTLQMSGVSIVNQLLFVFNLCVFARFPVPVSLRPNSLALKTMRVSVILSGLSFWFPLCWWCWERRCSCWQVSL